MIKALIEDEFFIGYRQLYFSVANIKTDITAKHDYISIIS